MGVAESVIDKKIYEQVNRIKKLMNLWLL
jgi:hypothetical protein